MHKVSLALAILLAAQQSPSQQQDTVIKSGVEEVVLDVIVRDAKGKMVKNLEASELTILEDGAPQKIRSFKLVAGRDARQEVVAAGSATSSAVVKTVAPASPLPAVNLICLVFQNLDPFNKKYATEAAQEFVKNQMVPNTWIAAFTMSSKLSPVHDFTTNRDEIFKSVANIYTAQGIEFQNVADAVINASPNITTIETTISGSGATTSAVSTLNTSGGSVNNQAINGAEVSTGVGASRVRGDQASARRQFGGIEGRRSMDQIENMIDQLKTLPGHKSVLLLTPGMPTNGDADQFAAIIKRANQANVTFYAIDINGLSENSNALAGSTALAHSASVSASQASSSSSAAVNMEKMRQGDYVESTVRTSDQRATLRALSEGTGGFLIADTNDLRKPYQKLLEDVATHYEVTYASTGEKHDGHLRTIQVKASRPDLIIESRTGYYAMPALNGTADLKPYELTGLAALNVKTRPNAFDFATSEFEFRPAGGNSQHALAVELPASSLSATAIPTAKIHRLHVSLLSLIKDANGEVVDKFSQDASLDIPDDKLAALQSGTIPFTHAIDLPAGHYSVETAVVDMESKRASARVMQFDSPAHKGVGLSSVMLVQRLEALKEAPKDEDPFVFGGGQKPLRRVIPELAVNFKSGAKPYAFFVVYPDKTNTEKPKIQVEFLVDGKVMAKQISDLPAPDPSGAIPMVVATAMQPGKCELRISALQGSATAVQSVNYSVAAN